MLFCGHYSISRHIISLFLLKDLTFYFFLILDTISYDTWSTKPQITFLKNKTIRYILLH